MPIPDNPVEAVTFAEAFIRMAEDFRQGTGDDLQVTAGDYVGARHCTKCDVSFGWLASETD